MEIVDASPAAHGAQRGPDAVPAVSLRALAKRFGATLALDGATLSIAQGTVHGLVGQNGAGKSTLIKILAGLVEPDEGAVALFGQALTEITPAKAAEAGITFIHQDRLLVPTATVGETLFLGRESSVSRFGVWRPSLEARGREALQRFFGVTLPRGVLIRDLTTAQQQLVQITRALLTNPRVIVFDEPTAALTKVEVDSLFRAIAALKARGLTVLYVSHYLAEIERICDVVTVMRNGQVVAQVDPKTTPLSEITRLMVGRDIKDLFPKTKVSVGDVVLEVERLSSPDRFHDVSFALRRGEILGLTGLVGSGAKELTQALFGLAPVRSGRVRIAGHEVRPPTPLAAARHGLALVPEDRRAQGVALDLTLRENLTLASLGQFSRWGRLDEAAERRRSHEVIGELGIKAQGPEARVRTLSGGNQQKVVIGKWLSRNSDVYILDEPSVGVDVAAKTDIYRLIGRLAERGAAILILSADLDELIGIADRVLVLHRGAVVAEERAADTSPDRLLSAALTGTVTSREVPHVA